MYIFLLLLLIIYLFTENAVVAVVPQHDFDNTVNINLDLLDNKDEECKYLSCRTSIIPALDKQHFLLVH